MLDSLLLPQSCRSQILHGMDDEGGEYFYIQALGFRSDRLPQYINLTIAFTGSLFFGFCCRGLIYKVEISLFERQ